MKGTRYGGRQNSALTNDLPTKEQTSTMYQSSLIPTSSVNLWKQDSVNTGQHLSNRPLQMAAMDDDLNPQKSSMVDMRGTTSPPGMAGDEKTYQSLLLPSARKSSKCVQFQGLKDSACESKDCSRYISESDKNQKSGEKDTADGANNESPKESSPGGQTTQQPYNISSIVNSWS